MFEFLNMSDNYEDRKVDRYESNNFIIDTAAVSDGKQPFETGVSHPKYNDGKWIIVEAYDTKEKAHIGHNNWVEIMTADKLPTELRDCYNAEISDLISSIGGDDFMVFKRQQS